MLYGNDLGTAEGTLFNITWLNGSDSVSFIQVNNTTSTDWASSGYVTFIINDLSKSAQVQRQNLWHADLQDSIVLVNEGSQSYQCPIKDLPDKATDSRIMLVNKGGVSYQTKTTDVVAGYVPPLPPVPAPTMDYNANTYGVGSSVWVDSSGNGNNLTVVSTPSYIGSSPQNALQFRPNDWAYVVLPENIPYRSFWAYEAWVRCDNPTNLAPNPICQVTNNTTSTNPSSYDLIFYHWNGRQIIAGLYNGSVRTAVGSTDDSLNTQYNHLVAQYDGNRVRIYKNGFQVAESASIVGQNTTTLRMFRVAGTKTEGWTGGTNTKPNCGEIDLQRLRVWIGSYLSQEDINNAYQEFLSMQ